MCEHRGASEWKKTPKKTGNATKYLFFTFHSLFWCLSMNPLLWLYSKSIITNPLLIPLLGNYFSACDPSLVKGESRTGQLPCRRISWPPPPPMTRMPPSQPGVPCRWPRAPGGASAAGSQWWRCGRRWCTSSPWVLHRWSSPPSPPRDRHLIVCERDHINIQSLETRTW